MDEDLEDTIIFILNVRCKKCENAFVSHSNLYKHIRFDHRSSDETEFVCQKCDFTFPNKSEFSYHLSGVTHNQHTNQDFSDEEDYDDEIFIEKCNYCGRIYNSYKEKDYHLSNYLRCESCEVRFQFRKREHCERF